MEQDHDIRLQEFRQLRREIRGSKDCLVIGVDIAKARHHAFFGLPTGKTLLRKLVLDNTKEGFESLCFHADSLRVQYDLKKIVFGMEPTADYHKPLAEYLIRRGYMVVLVGGTAVKNNRQTIDGRWDKNDIKDSANIADLITQGKCLFYDLPSHTMRDLRNLLSLRKRLKRLEQGYKVRIRNHLIAQYFPEMDTYLSYGEGPAIVKWCLDPKEITSLPFEEFYRMVSSCNGGEKQRIRLRNLYDKAASSIGCKVTPSIPYEANTILRELKNLTTMIKETDIKIEEIGKGFPEYHSLLSIPGFGPDTSSRVLAALGNPHRFENERQVLRLAGLDLSKTQSGTYQGIPVISKKGKADLRYSLYQSALIASTRDPAFIAYFTHRIEGRQRERGIKTRMRVKLAAKMLVIAWTLMKKKEKFNPEYIKG